MAKSRARLDQLRGKYQPARTTREICMNGALQAAFEEAQTELEAANRRRPMGPALAFDEVDPVLVAAQKVEAIREAMVGSMETFTFQAMGSHEYADLLVQHPPRKDVQEPWNSDTFVPALIAACCVDADIDPSVALVEENLPFDVDQARELCYMLSSAQLDELFDGAYRVNVKAVDVPFSALASRTVLSSDQS